MLERTRTEEFQRSSLGGVDASSDRLNLEQIISAARRQLWAVIGSIIFMVMVGIVYVYNSPSIYTATTQLLIDVNNVQIVDKLTSTAGTDLGDGVIASQIELFTAEDIGDRVIRKLDLLNNPRFMSPPPGPIGKLLGSLLSPFASKSAADGEQQTEQAAAPADQEAVKRERALAILGSNLSALRVGQTYSIKLGYSDPDPQLAAQIAQTYAESYLLDQLESKYDAQRRASEWMQSRIDELRQKSVNSDMAVQDFRREHNLLQTGGALLSERQLADVSTQLSAAQADSGRAKAKYDQIDAMIKSGNVDAVVSDSLTSAVINQLRTKYLEASRLRSEILPRLGNKHEQVVRLDSEMNEYKRLIFGELARIGESYRNDFEIARAKEDELTKRLASVSGTSSDANTTQVQLRELERESDSYRTLYQTFLQQLQESRQQQSFPITEARIITNAMVPQVRSSPKTGLTLVLCVMLGGILGGVIAGLREFRDTFFRTGDQIRDELRMAFLGYMPFIRDRNKKARGLKKPGVISKTNAVQDYAVTHPFSAGAETLRNIKVTIDHAVGGADLDRPIVLGIVSVLPQEGKSTISINLAEMLAMDGSTTLLIDCDLRNPSLTKTLASNSVVGLQDCVINGLPVKDAVVRNPNTGLIMLPTGGRGRAGGAPHTPVRNTSDFFSSRGMADTLAQAKGCKYVVLDLPPIAALVDARVVAAYVDAFVLVVEWGKTARRSVRTTMSHESVIADKCVGVVLNRVDMKKIRQYQSYGSVEFYHKRMANYYEKGPA